MLLEAEKRKKEIIEPLTSVYVGGGTPSLLKPEQIEFFFQNIKKIYSFSDVGEFSIEANPGTLSESFLKISFEEGVNRVSLGMQSSSNSILKMLGRIHTFEEVKYSVDLLKKTGMNNFNLDLIFGIPNQTMSDWKETLFQAIHLEPKHISAYGLIPEEGTPLFDSLANGKCSLPSPDLERDMYDYAVHILKHYGYHQYEISNFAMDGFQCRHNIGYWDQTPYIGLGVSASSLVHLQKTEKGLSYVRITNPGSMEKYLKMISEDDFSLAETEEITPEEARFETIMLSSRMNHGISEKRFKELHGVSVEKCYGNCLKRLEQNGLLKYSQHCWKLTRYGMDVQNSILLEFMDNQT